MATLTPQEAQKVADALWQIEWNSETDGYMKCPGQESHSTKNGPRDCRIMIMKDGNFPPTIKCLHGSCGAAINAANFALRSALGKAESQAGWVPPSRDWAPDTVTVAQKKEPAMYDPEKLKLFAGDLAGVIDLPWLANRSVLDPSRVSSAEFLDTLYRQAHGERVLVFQNEYSQGEAIWPNDELPTRGTKGVWFLAQPVDGEYRPNPRSRKRGEDPVMSRRSEESVRDWRFMVLESDEAPARLWLAALVQLPVKISAIYTSGGKSIHALVRVDARIKDEWDQEKTAIKDGLVTLGADPASMSGVRLTRLPGCWREGKVDRDGKYVKFDAPAYQKLLYVNPDPIAAPLADLIPRRDVLKEIHAESDKVAVTVGTAPLEEIEAFRYRTWYYSPACEVCAAATVELDEVIAMRREPANT